MCLALYFFFPRAVCSEIFDLKISIDSYFFFGCIAVLRTGLFWKKQENGFKYLHHGYTAGVRALSKDGVWQTDAVGF